MKWTKITKKRKQGKKKKTSKRVLQSDDSEEENRESVTVRYQESDEDNDWHEEDIENDPVFLTEDCLKKPLPHVPREGEYILVEFATKKSKIYYALKVLESRNTNLEYYVSFLRKKSLNKFHVPNKPVVSYVTEPDIKVVLPKPILLLEAHLGSSLFICFL